MSALSPCGYSQSSADSRDDMSMSPPMSVTLSPKSMNHLLNMSHEEQVANNIIAATDLPYMRITEQPTEKFRFRYKSEMMGTHGSLLGKSSASEKNRKKSFPSVELCNYDGDAIIRCSLFTAQRAIELRTPHTHRLVVKVANSSEVNDPHEQEVNARTGYKAVFQGMGIIHTAKKYIAEELLSKKKARFLESRRYNKNATKTELSAADLTRLKSEVAKEARSMDLNVVSLCFECFELLPNHKIGLQLCAPVFSTSINNMKSALTGELKICRIDRHVSSCRGNEEVWMLVEKVGKKNIRVRLFETDEEDNEVWSDYGKFSELDVHHQFAIVFRTPPYKDTNIQEPVKVFLQLYRPTDGDRSEPIAFTYKPDPAGRNRKRKRAGSTVTDDVEKGFECLPECEKAISNNVLQMSGMNGGYLNGYENPLMPQLPDLITQQPDLNDHLNSFPSIEQVLNADGRLASSEVIDFIVNFPSEEYDWNMIRCDDLVTDGGSSRRLRPISDTAANETVSKTKLKPAVHGSVPKPDATVLGRSKTPADVEVYLSETDGTVGVRPADSCADGQSRKPAANKGVNADAAATRGQLIKVRTDLSARGKTDINACPSAAAGKNKSLSGKVASPTAEARLPAAPGVASIGEGGKQPSPQQKAGGGASDPEALVLRVTARLTQMLTGKKTEQPQVLANAVRDMFSADRTDEGDTALHVAIAHDERDYVTVMLNALCTGQPCFGPRGSLKDVLDLRNDKDETALHLAVLLNQPETVRALLRGGANPNLSDVSGEYPLHLAARHGRQQCLRELTAAANYRQGGRQLHVNVKNEQGWTALHVACLKRDLPCVRILCQSGRADPNARDKSGGRSALHVCVEEQDVCSAAYLLQCTPVDIDLQDAAGNTALHVAVVVGDSGNKELCDLLLRAKANPHVSNYAPAPRSRLHPSVKPEAASSDEDDEEDEYDERRTALDLATENREIYEIFQNSMEPTTKNGDDASDDEAALIIDMKKETDESDHYQAADPMFDAGTLDRLSSLLDCDARWERLASLLDYGFLVSSLRSTDVASPAKALLNYTELHGTVTVDKVRELLEILDQTKAVEIIDLMLARRFAERSE